MSDMNNGHADRFKFRVWNDMQNCYSMDDHYISEDGFINTVGDYVLEQCTGLKDKNGKLIYEGDILKCVHSDIMKYKIYWGIGCWRMKAYGTNNKIVDDTHLFLDTDVLEVIGNIHENADLLEHKND